MDAKGTTDAGLPPTQAMAGMNAIASTVRGTIGMVAETLEEPTTPGEFAALVDRLPVEEFPYLRESALCPADFFEGDFDFGVRALARGLLGCVGNETGRE